MTSVFSLIFLIINLADGFHEEKEPSVVIAILIRNKAHLLPHFFKYLEDLDYPKDRISLFIRSDHNEDDTTAALNIWINKKHDYHSIDFEIGSEDEKKFPDEKNAADISHLRFKHVMSMKEEGLEKAKDMWADYIWFLDADVFITYKDTLKKMTSIKNMTVFAPMLKSNGAYSNYWSRMGSDYYYRRTEDYSQILERKKVGCFPVPLVHASTFVNLNILASEDLTYFPPNKNVPFDDMISFAVSAKESYICNDKEYGYIMIPSQEEDDELEKLINLKLEIIADLGTLKYGEELEKFVPDLPEKTKVGYDEIYLINLERRWDRFEKMRDSFGLLGIDYKWIKAVDGKVDINDQYLKDNGIKMMPKFVEPFHDRPIKRGEIGCFLSHFSIWKDVIDKGHDKVIVFEDDIRFEPYFIAKLHHLEDEIKKLDLDWHLIFLGRKILPDIEERLVENSDLLLHVNYTYWTLGYVLSNEGAKILVDEDPLSKIIPVDEYLPIMYDRHPNKDWKSMYNNRILKAFSVHPRFLHPTHYVGDDGYISDTEDSFVIKIDKEKDEL